MQCSVCFPPCDNDVGNIGSIGVTQPYTNLFCVCAHYGYEAAPCPFRHVTMAQKKNPKAPPKKTNDPTMHIAGMALLARDIAGTGLPARDDRCVSSAMPADYSLQQPLCSIEQHRGQPYTTPPQGSPSFDPRYMHARVLAKILPACRRDSARLQHNRRQCTPPTQ